MVTKVYIEARLSKVTLIAGIFVLYLAGNEAIRLQLMTLFAV